MDEERIFILLSLPKNFVDKFSGFINNVNILNDSSENPVIKIEKVYFKKKQEFAAVPIEGE